MDTFSLNRIAEDSMRRGQRGRPEEEKATELEAMVWEGWGGE